MGLLDLAYDLRDVSRTFDLASLERREPWVWRYRELLPVDAFSELPFLQVGMTPVHGAPRLAAWVGIAGLWLKDEGRNPSGAIEDRAACVSVVKAQESKRRGVAIAGTAGEASALAALAAAVDLPAFLFVPQGSEGAFAQASWFGATVIRVPGDLDAALDLCRSTCTRHGLFDATLTASPYPADGMKSCGLEIAEQLSSKMPDWVVVPLRDGAVLHAVYKGLRDMHLLGITKTVPRILGVEVDARPHPAEAAPSSASSRFPTFAEAALAAVRSSEGATIEVLERDVPEAQRAIACRGAVQASTGAAAAVAGLERAVSEGLVARDQTAMVVVVRGASREAPAGFQALDASDLDQALGRILTR
jgi:threonine synthase